LLDPVGLKFQAKLCLFSLSLLLLTGGQIAKNFGATGILLLSGGVVLFLMAIPSAAKSIQKLSGEGSGDH
jgi:hypothetical protein